MSEPGGPAALPAVSAEPAVETPAPPVFQAAALADFLFRLPLVVLGRKQIRCAATKRWDSITSSGLRATGYLITQRRLLLVDQSRRFAVFRCLFVGKCPAEQVPVLPGTCGEFDTEGKAVRIEPGRNHNSRCSNLVHPIGGAVRAAAGPPVRLWDRFIIRRHLKGRINQTIEMKAIESLFVCSKRPPLRIPEKRFRIRIAFKNPL